MKNVTKHTGTLEIIERDSNNGTNGNPRYIVRLDGYTCRTAVDSSLGYSITNYEGKTVTAHIGTHYGVVTIENVRVIEGSHLFYNKDTQTIRQHPENYCIAYKREGRWISEPDLSANKELCLKVYKELFKHSSKYGSGANLIERLTK